MDDHALEESAVNNVDHNSEISFLSVPGSPDDHRIHADGDAAHFNASQAIDIVLDLALDGAADRHQIDAVIHDDIQFDGDGLVIILGDLYTLGHGLPAEQVDQTVGLGTEGHTFHAVAAGGHRASNIGKDVAGQADPALFGLYSHGTLPFFAMR